MLVEVPPSVHLTWEDLVRHVAHKAFVEAQPGLVQEAILRQGPLTIGDGPLEAAGTFAADLQGETVTPTAGKSPLRLSS